MKIKEIGKNLKLEKNFSKLGKYHGHDNIEYKGIRDANFFFDLSIDEGYYKSIIAISAFNNNYLEYESKGDKNKILLIK